MAATNDTIDGLLAEFRGYAAGMPDSYHVTMSWADFRRMLDRFDAAHKREMKESEDRETKLIKALESANEHATKIAVITTVEKLYKENLEVVRHHAVEIGFTAAEVVEEVKKEGGEA